MEATNTTAVARAKAPRKPKAPRAAAAPAVRTDEQVQKITAAIGLIDELAAEHVDRLVIDLTEDHGLKLPKTRDLRYTARMHGIDGSPAAVVRLALVNWANAARRALLGVEG